MNYLLILLLFSVSYFSYGSPPKSFILDTDSNYFADDCLALGLFLKSPELKIEGITLVAGTQYPKQGIEYLTHILKMFQRSDIPVYLGEEAPLMNNLDRVRIMRELWHLGFAGAFDLPIPTADNISPPMGGVFSGISAQSEHAFSFLVKSLEASRSQMTIVAIGPMTNNARLIQERADLISKIDSLIFMGGNVRTEGNVTKAAEFNFWFDPEAAQIVLRSKIKKKIMIGLDLTSQARFVYADYLKVAAIQNPLAAAFAFELGEMWPGFEKDPTAIHYIWDAIIPVYMLHPEVVTTSEDLYLDVITEFGADYGGVRVVDHSISSYPVTVLTGLDSQKFRERFFELLEE